MYGSWDTEWQTEFFVILGCFLPICEALWMQIFAFLQAMWRQIDLSGAWTFQPQEVKQKKHEILAFKPLL